MDTQNRTGKKLCLKSRRQTMYDTRKHWNKLLVILERQHPKELTEEGIPNEKQTQRNSFYILSFVTD